MSIDLTETQVELLRAAAKVGLIRAAGALAWVDRRPFRMRDLLALRAARLVVRDSLNDARRHGLFNVTPAGLAYVAALDVNE